MSRETFTLPDLGEGLTEAHLVRWLVKPGDPVTVDAPVAEVETAKAMVEVPSPFGGVVVELHAAEDATVLVGEPLISIESARPAAADDAPDGAPDDAGAGRADEEARGGSGNVLVGYGTTTHGAARRRRRAGKHAAQGAASAERPRVVSPLVRAMAKEKGVDLATLRGTGSGGLITRADVERATQGDHADRADRVDRAAAGQAAATAPAAPNGLGIRERIPLRGVRAAIATSMSRSRREIPEATTWVDVDATALVALRAELGSGPERGPGLLALIARFTVAGLDRFPVLNARIDADAGEIRVFDGVNLGVAAQTDRGLLVPVVRDAHRLSARRLDTAIREVVAAARDGSAGPGGLSAGAGSFTLNNYGSFGVDGGAAIINHPEVAILGVGRIIERPWIVDGAVVPRHITQLSLAFDHRVCDGGTAAGFLRFVADAIESPQSALADL